MRNPRYSGRIHRSRANRALLGVCGGVAEFYGISPTLVRLLAVIIPGIGWFTYLIAAVFMPEDRL